MKVQEAEGERPHCREPLKCDHLPAAGSMSSGDQVCVAVHFVWCWSCCDRIVDGVTRAVRLMPSWCTDLTRMCYDCNAACNHCDLGVECCVVINEAMTPEAQAIYKHCMTQLLSMVTTNPLAPSLAAPSCTAPLFCIPTIHATNHGHSCVACCSQACAAFHPRHVATPCQHLLHHHGSNSVASNQGQSSEQPNT